MWAGTTTLNSRNFQTSHGMLMQARDMLTTAMVLSPEDCATFARPVLRTGRVGWCGQRVPRPPWPDRGVPVECGSNRAVPRHPRPSLVIHTPTYHQSAPNSKRPIPILFMICIFHPPFFPMLRIILIIHLGQYHWNRWSFSIINKFLLLVSP